MIKKLLLTLILISPAGFALVLGGSNLGMFGYDEHSCTKPFPPSKPYAFNSQWEIDTYNNEVDYYNSERESYVRCIRDYVDNAENDIEIIKEAIESAIDEANS